jgi:4-aminobutyrate aminotransferase-like enzyme
VIENGLMENAAQQGMFLLEALAAMRPRHHSIGHVRGQGLLIAVELGGIRSRMSRRQT